MTADGTPLTLTVDWRLIAQRLALALARQRSETHREGACPCTTCRYSGLVLFEYLVAVAESGEEAS